MFKSEVFKSISLLSSGTVIAQLIPLILAPVIARLFNANQFGEFAAVMSILNILSVVLNGRYELAIVLPKLENEARLLLIGTWGIGLLFSASFFITSFLFFNEISEYFGIQYGWFESLIISISLLGISIWQPINYYFIRNKQYLKMTYNKFVKSTSTTFITILVGYFVLNGGLNGLVLGLFLGWCFLAAFSLHQLNLSKIIASFNLGQLKAVLTQYENYPKYNALPALLNSIASQLGIYVFVFFYSTEISGYYSFSKQYLYVPLSILGISLSQVFFQRISEKYRNNHSVIKELKLLFLFLVSIGLVGCSIIIPFSEELFELVFGPQWKLSAEMSKILIICFSVQFVVSPLSTVLHALNRVKLAALFPIVYLAFMLGLFCIEKVSLNLFLKYYALTEIIPYIFYLSLIIVAVYQYEIRINKIKLKSKH